MEDNLNQVLAKDVKFLYLKLFRSDAPKLN